MQKIIDLGKFYANSFLPCFTENSTDSFKMDFAAKRYINTTSDYELIEEERNNKELMNIFTTSFVNEVNRLLEEKNIKVDQEGKKVKLVKRKKD